MSINSTDLAGTWGTADVCAAAGCAVYVSVVLVARARRLRAVWSDAEDDGLEGMVIRRRPDTPPGNIKDRGDSGNENDCGTDWIVGRV